MWTKATLTSPSDAVGMAHIAYRRTSLVWSSAGGTWPSGMRTAEGADCGLAHPTHDEISFSAADAAALLDDRRAGRACHGCCSWLW